MKSNTKPAEKPANAFPPGVGGSFYNGGYGYMPGAGMYGGAGMMMPPGVEEPETIVVTKLFSSRRDLDRMASGVDFPHQYHSGWDLYNSLASPSSDNFYGRKYSTDALGRKESGAAAKAATAKGVGATGADAEGKVRGSSAVPQKAPHATATTNGVVAANGGVKPSAGGRNAAAARDGAPVSASHAPPSANARRGSVQPQNSLSSTDVGNNNRHVISRPVSPDATADYDLYAQRRRTSHNSATDVSHIPLPAAHSTDDLRAIRQPSENLDEIPQLRSDYVASGSAYGRLDSSARDMLGGSTMNPSANMSLLHNEYSAPDVNEHSKPMSATDFHAPRPAGSATQARPVDGTAAVAERKEPRAPAATKTRTEKPHEEAAAHPAPAAAPRPSRLSNFESSTTMLAGSSNNNATSLYDAVPSSQPQSRPQSTQLLKEPVAPAATAADKRENEAAAAGTRSVITPTHGRSTSRRASRPVSRLTSMSVIEFPQGEEVADEVGQTGLGDSQHMRETEERKSRLESARAEARTSRQKEREAKRAADEAAQRQREELQKERREQRVKEEQMRREAVAALDEERRERHAAELAAREQQREAEKRRFLETTKAEEEREAQRVKAILEERQRRLAEEAAAGGSARGGSAQVGSEAAPSRTGAASRPRSRLRPPSRPASVLRGAIPEQPPDVVGGQIEDTLADELATAKEKTAAHAHAHQRHETSSGAAAKKAAPVLPPSPPAMPIVGGGVTPGAEPPVTAKAPSSVASSQLRSATPKSSGIATGSKTPAAAAEETNDESTTKEAPRKATNHVRTIVLMDESELGSTPLRHEPGTTTVHYHDEACTATAVVPTLAQAKLLQDVQKAACEGYNTAILGAEAPFAATRFDSPVWQSLVGLVGELLRANSDGEGRLTANFDVTCALGYVLKEQVKDLFSEDDASPFENVSVHPSPIYGPRIKQLVYSQVTSLEAFEAYLHAALTRAQANPMLAALTEGVVVAFVLVKQTRMIKDTQDVFLSSIVVAAAGTDPVPYESACSRARNVYGAVFHLVLGGPCLTCFVLDANVSPRKLEGDAAAQQSFDALYKLSQGLSSFENYSLRSGSVRRFIRYVEQAQNQVKERLRGETDEAQRKKLERYKAEQQRLLDSAHKMLDEASYTNTDEL